MIPFGTQKAPSPSVVLPYYVTAAFAFLVLTVLMLISGTSFTGHYFQPHILTITHLAALGWGTMMIFGASHQLLPVVMEVHLFSEKLAKWCYGLLLPGIILLTVSFWRFTPGVPMEAGALLILSAVILYVINVQRTARQNKKWTISSECIVTAAWWLLLTAILGTLLVFNLRYPFFPQDHLYYLKIHAHLGMAGWFLLMIMGVASRLIPMFLLSHHEPGKPVRIAYYCINASLLGFLIMAFLFNTERYWPVFALIALAGVIAYGIFVRRAYKKAMRKKMDRPMKITMIAIILMLVPFLLLIVLAFLSPEAGGEIVTFSLAYGISILGGFITAIILGQTFKTLPFIVWMHRYKKLIGKTKTPLPRELYRDHWVNYQFYAYLLGYAALLAGVLTRVQWLITLGCAGFFITAVCYNINVFLTVTHQVKHIAETKKTTDELSN
jgi:hypothetical protein